SWRSSRSRSRLMPMRAIGIARLVRITRMAVATMSSIRVNPRAFFCETRFMTSIARNSFNFRLGLPRNLWLLDGYRSDSPSHRHGLHDGITGAAFGNRQHALPASFG